MLRLGLHQTVQSRRLRRDVLRGFSEIWVPTGADDAPRPVRLSPEVEISKDSRRLTPSRNHCAARRIWASDVRVGRVGSRRSLLIPSWHAVLSDPGESDIDIFQNFDA